jgi:sarcosine oxidase
VKIAVIGAGVIGLSTAKSLVETGRHEVRCYEAAEPMGGRSTGDTRVFRVSHADVQLIELAVRARRSWDEWSEAAGIELVGREGQLGDVPDAEARLAAMQLHDVPARVVEDTKLLSPLTSQRMDKPLLHDPWAGVIRAADSGRFLLQQSRQVLVADRVEIIETVRNGAIVRTATDSWTCDSVVIVAGIDTARLAATNGMNLSIEQAHVARFTFRMHDRQAVVPNWFETFGRWSTWGMTVSPGHWAMGVHWPGEPSDPSIPQENSTALRLQELRSYIDERLDRVHPEPVDAITCIGDAGGDGIKAVRQGPVLALWGDNLFKFAPILGSALSEAAISLGLPQLPLTNS